MITETKITMSSSVDRSIEGQYIKILVGSKKMYGKVLAVTSPTTLTVHWYSRWEWFWLSLWFLPGRVAAQLRMHLTAFGVGMRAQSVRLVEYLKSLLAKVGGR
jgi:hypothetical protein